MLRIDVFSNCPEGNSKEKNSLIKGFDTQSKDFMKLKNLVTMIQPTPVNSIVFLALREVFRQIETHENKPANSLLQLSKDFEHCLLD